MADRSGYIGRAPGDSSIIVARQTHSPTGVQTDFTFASGYTVGYIDAYLNGIRLINAEDYTATDGTTVGLTSAANNGDILELVAYKAFNLANVAAATGNFSVGNNLTVTDNLTVSGDATSIVNITGTAGTFTDLTVTDQFTGNATGTAATFTTITATDQFSGNISGIAATFTGPVTIGGTLTYEDATNVDSVGLVTARTGVRVTAGGIVVAGVSTFAAVDINGSVLTLDADGDTTITADTDDQIDIAFGGNDRLTLSAGLIDLKNDGSQSAIRLYCESSNAHYAALQAPAHSAFSGNITLTLPATTDTLVARTTTDTLTNKTLTDPSITDKIIHSGDTNTAIRFPAADTFTVETAGSERVRVTSAGLVGIGTNNPNQELHIHTTSGTSYIQFTDETSGVAATDGAIFGLDHPHLYAWNYEAGDFVVATNATEKLRVNSDGEVGIGTNNPTATLQLFGDSSSSFRISKSGILAYDHTFNGTSYTISNNNGSAGIPIILGTKTSGSESVRIDASGNVGLGTNNPANMLHIEGSSPSIRLKMSDGPRHMISPFGGSLFIEADNDNGVANTNIIFNVDGSSKLAITSDGKLGIGLTTPQRDLHIHNSDSSTNSYLQITSATTGTTSTDGFQLWAYGSGGSKNAAIVQRETADIEIWTSNSEKVRVGSAGSVHIGDNTSNANGHGLLTLSKSASEAFNALVIQQGNTGFTATDGLHIGIDAGVDAYFKLYENRAIYFTTGTSNAERLRITSDGSIGTKGLVPTDGSFVANSTIRSQNSSSNISYIGFAAYTGDTSVGDMYSYMGGDGRNSGYLNFSTNDTERIRILANGQVGIGTDIGGVNEPASALTVLNTASGNEHTHIDIISDNNETGAIRFVDGFDHGVAGVIRYAHNQAKNNIGANSFGFYTNTRATPSFQVKDDGDCSIADGNLIFANDHGIDFSATQGAGSAGAANCVFDDYEEGTWTPVLNKSGVAGVVSSPNSAIGHYVKSGHLLFISFYFYKSSGSFGNNSDLWYISGLPYTVKSETGGSYQSILLTYAAMNGNTYNHNSSGAGSYGGRWQSNNTNGQASITMYGQLMTTNWSSGAIEFGGSGVLYTN